MARAVWRLLLLGAAVALLWHFVIPSAVGGRTSYVTTHGISMAPDFQSGDLAVVRTAGTYAVGDVVAYRSDLLDSVVMHRIVEVTGGRFVFKGDNNSFLDPEEPTQDMFIGKLALRVPGGGVVLDRASSPTALAIVAFGFIICSGTAVQVRRRRRKRSMSRHAMRSKVLASGAPPWASATAAVLGLLGFLGVLLAVPAWTAPDPRPDAGAAAQSMTFDYEAEVPRSAAYDDTLVSAPDPVFLKLAESVKLRYTYRGEPGTVDLAARLSTASGWHSTVPLGPRAPVSATPHTGSVVIDPSAMLRRAEAAGRATGIPSDQVDVSVVADVVTASGRFTPRLKLSLTPLQLKLAEGKSSLVVPREPVGDPGATPEPLSVAGVQMEVSTGRWVAFALLALALIGTVVIGLLVMLGAPASEGASIRRRYSPLLVKVEPMSTPPGRPVVDVEAFGTLVKLAERYGLLVMHWARSDVETFIVQDEGTIYRYRTEQAPHGDEVAPDHADDHAPAVLT